ncbi:MULTISPECIES: VOC family protein [Microbacterium]|uniref:VOC family protein n=1 Tax=Microbacterium TaxID=33882 RepID=UPI001E2B6E09|nr:VOC family protein [Microbacterium nymphoidis]MCD2500069.1 VOC family protein [Microbacterium nymphoidis]
MTVTGIGGVFFRSRDPQARSAWYRQHLGIAAGEDAAWTQEAGMTVFAPFPQDSDYFDADQPFMLNLRVTDLTALVVRLRAAGIEVETRDEWVTDFGRFARLRDPEGLPIELWELAP